MADLTLPHTRPYEFSFPVKRTALLLIDLQRDFLDPNGFGSIQCGNPAIFAAVRRIVPTIQRVLAHARAMGLHIIHTREGHRPDLGDLPAAKRLRQISAPDGHHALAIGDQGPMGRLLVRGEYGHDLIDELAARPGELVVDKPGKGSFWGTSFHRELLARGITHLLVGGVTTECCVTTTIRECNDRGFQCCLLSDCTDGFDAQMVSTAADTICAQDGLFGFVGGSADFLALPIPIQQTSPVHLSPEIGYALPSIREMQRLFCTGEDPVRVVNLVFDKIEKYQHVNPGVWVHLRGRESVIAEAVALAARYEHGPETPCQGLPPLFGVPFAVQANIHGGCPNTLDNNVQGPAVQSLVSAGAIVIGTLNHDHQENGYGLTSCCALPDAPHSFHNPDHGAGSSASGAAVAVAAGLVSFALATDTTGGSLVPAGLNGIVGFKPTKGTIPSTGINPICPSLDTLAILAARPEDARTVWVQTAQYSPDDPHAKPPSSLPVWHVDFRGPRTGGFRFAIPDDANLETWCSKPVIDRFRKTVQNLLVSGGSLGSTDYNAFGVGSDLAWAENGIYFYEHIFAAKRSLGEKEFSSLPSALQQVWRPFFFPAEYDRKDGMETALEICWQMDQLRELGQMVREVFGQVDVVVVPTAPGHPALDDDHWGVFTRVVNILDLCAVSVPAGSVSDGDGGDPDPFGITLLGASGCDAKILDLATELFSVI